MDVHLRDLRYFVAVAEELSFSRAAERLFVSQPTVSKQVRGLERALRTSLFKRDGRTITLTATGSELLETARALISDWDRAERELREVASRDAETIVVGIHTGVVRGLTTRLAEVLRGRRPETSLQFRQVGWEDPTAGLADGETDAAILWLPLPDDRRYSVEVLVSEPRLVLLPRRHPLADLELVTPEQLAGERFLALPSSAGPLREFWLGIDAGLSPEVAGEVRAADEAFEAVAAGTGVALASEGNALHYAHEGVVARPVDGLAPAQLAVAWRSDDTRPALADFVSASVTAARSGLAV